MQRFFQHFFFLFLSLKPRNFLLLKYSSTLFLHYFSFIYRPSTCVARIYVVLWMNSYWLLFKRKKQTKNETRKQSSYLNVKLISKKKNFYFNLNKPILLYFLLSGEDNIPRFPGTEFYLIVPDLKYFYNIFGMSLNNFGKHN